MSKSKFNGLPPLDFASKYGIDSIRLAVTSLAPVESDVVISEQNVAKISNKIEKIFVFVEKFIDRELDTTKGLKFDKGLIKVLEDY